MYIYIYILVIILFTTIMIRISTYIYRGLARGRGRRDVAHGRALGEGPGLIIILIVIILLLVIIMIIMIRRRRRTPNSRRLTAGELGRPGNHGSHEIRRDRPREDMVGVDMVLAQYPQNTLYHRIYIIHDGF